MQLQSNASLAFINLSADRKPPIGTDMANGITSHRDTFLNPPVAGADLTTINGELTEGAARARTGDKTAIAALLNIEKRWDDAFRDTAKYVSRIANGNEEIIRMGGCTPTKNESTPSHEPAASENVEVEALKGHGTVQVSSDADAAVKAYLYVARAKNVLVRQDGNSLVFEMNGEIIAVVQADTHRKMIFHNLPSDVRVWVSQLPLNNSGSGPLSPEQDVTPQ